ncbi:MAG: ABC transporter ATP-binding protein [Pararhodobacter sp.]|nr:ABC transporter ATP-binding protein [Pararhodobacter sp.]
MLKIEKLSVRYGTVHAVQDLDLAVAEGELVALLGPNGAGKSSTIEAIIGLVAAGGRVEMDGQDISRLPPELRIRRGLALSPEGRRVFAGLTVAENLRLAAATRRDRAGVRADTDRFMELFPVLRARMHQPAGTLSGGEQQMLAIARALMTRPRLLLLDEPSLGLAPRIVQRIFEVIAELKAGGMTILLVEQNAAHALRLADRAYVLGAGRLQYQGPARDLASDRLMSLYIGG